MKTELQKQFEEQTPTIIGKSRIEYLQTFVSWLHLQVEKSDIEITEDKIELLVKEIVYTLKGDDRILPEFYFRLGIESILTLIKQR